MYAGMMCVGSGTQYMLMLSHKHTQIHMRRSSDHSNDQIQNACAVRVFQRLILDVHSFASFHWCATCTQVHEDIAAARSHMLFPLNC